MMLSPGKEGTVSTAGLSVGNSLTAVDENLFDLFMKFRFCPIYAVLLKGQAPNVVTFKQVILFNQGPIRARIYRQLSKNVESNKLVCICA